MAFNNSGEAKLAGKIVRKLLRKRVVGSNAKEIDAIVNWFPSDEREEVRNLIQKLVRDQNSPLEAHRVGDYSAVRLTNPEDALAFVQQHSEGSLLEL